MANEFQLTYNGSQPVTLVGLLQNANGQFYNATTSAFETYNATNVPNYAPVTFIEVGSTAEMLGSMPSGLPVGKYRMSAYVKAGANLAVSDISASSWYGSTVIEWKGTAELSNAADLNLGLLANNTAIGSVGSAVAAQGGYIGGISTAVAALPAAAVSAMKADTVLGATFNRSKGKFTFSGSTLTLLADDGVTVIGSLTITQSSGTITSRV